MTYIKNNHLLYKENKRMNKIEAQKVLDSIDSDTIIDDNWLDYLLEDKRLLTLNALYTVFDMTYPEILEQYEGEYISKFQTKKEIYVGRAVKIINDFYIILNQNKDFCYYVDSCSGINRIAIANINKHLV
jgi:hypothetical protein